MNEAQIETLLRKAPQPAPPPGSLERLQAEIALPGAARSNGERPRVNPLRRWIPALAFGLFFLSCVVIIGVQANLVSQLQQQKQNLRAATANLEPLRSEHEKYQQLQAQSEQLERLRQEHEELVRLQAEIAQLRALVSGLD